MMGLKSLNIVMSFIDKESEILFIQIENIS